MKQIVQSYKTGHLELQDVPIPVCRSGGVLVRNACSVVSIGTERSMIDLAKKSIIGKARARPDLLKLAIDKAKKEGFIKTFKEAMNRLDMPCALGYSSAGKVIEIGDWVDEFDVGDRVACIGAGYASHAEVISVPKNLCAKIPENVGFDEAAFGMLGAIAVHGVRTAEVTFGEKVAVIGLGLLGQITVQLLKAAGCYVFGVDVDREKVNLSLELGADAAVVSGSSTGDLAERFSKGHGMDAVIITASAKTTDPIELASEMLRFRGRMVLVGVSKIDIPRQIFWEKEIRFRISRAGGPGIFDPTYELKGIDYPIGYVRWTERRNLEEFLELIGQGKVRLTPMITHRFESQEVVQAYEMLMGGKETTIGVLIEYGEVPDMGRKIVLNGTRRQGSGGKERIGVGVIGAGLFAKSLLLPAMAKIPNISFRGIATSTGINARQVGKKFNFEYCASDYREILEDEGVDCVVIVTRHDLHCRLTIDALMKGKRVFVEKPLAVSLDELRQLGEVWRETKGHIMVGYNRRFSPFSIKAKGFFERRNEPMVINYRGNAGFIPKNHWVHDVVEGGGRIVGEVCHFIDLVQYFTSSLPTKVYASRISGHNEAMSNSDNIAVNLKLEDGSIASILYVGNGDKSFSRERMELFAESSVCIIDDFRSVRFSKDGKTRTLKKANQDLGYSGELAAFFEAARRGDEIPVAFQEYIASALVTFKILESVRQDMPIPIDIKRSLL